jgi:hypothetical protein
MDTSMITRLKELEAENSRLKKMHPSRGIEQKPDRLSGNNKAGLSGF